MADEFRDILHNTLRLEGGETADNGGHTNYGITQGTYNAVAPALGLANKNVHDLNYGDVRKVYESEYYKKPKIAAISSPRVRGILFDHAVNSGNASAIKTLQNIVGVKADGIMGKKTLAAVDKYIADNSEDSLANDLLNSRQAFMTHLAISNPMKYQKNYNGWMNRIQKLKNQYQLSTAVPPDQLPP